MTPAVAAFLADPTRIAAAVGRYIARYRTPPPHPPGRVVLEIAVDRVRTLNL
ncbi:hypothetical protein [Actinocatenispora sera]|uniref:Uncharacterized protein n=1 Tax=Actinocatenispora sera TaxID=390989 RepID=A0A810KXB2_9ACTN|nr:hypothetical protein [Actinocatenispora sera]BCJ27557.1 hypothetical protein Asera_16650 [Actinocatenispora sera]